MTMKIEMVDAVTVAIGVFALLAYLRIGTPVYLYAALLLFAAEIFVQAREIMKK